MDRLKSMNNFVQVVLEGGFTAASQKLGISRAQISKSVMQLEEYLSTRLLNRTTRKISLTETGRSYFNRCQDILLDIEEIECIASEQTGITQGTITISAPSSFGINHLQKAIPEYINKYPQVKINISLTDRLVDVISEGFDVAIRISKLEDSTLIARKIAPCKQIFCASPDYLIRNGIPLMPKDLSSHACLVYSNELNSGTWILQNAQKKESVKVNGPVSSDNGDLLKSAAISGLGITLLPTFIVGAEINTGSLQQVLYDYCPPEISVYALYPSRRYQTTKVRTFIDFLADYFGEQPDWDTKVTS